jgi:hypothetical protein
MAQTCLGCNGGFGPVNFPLFQGWRRFDSKVGSFVIGMVISLAFKEDEHAPANG